MTIPIPHRPSGMLVGTDKAQVTIDAFVDIQCPHSKRVWPVIQELRKHYDTQPVSLQIQLITLSNHRQSWDISLGLFAVAQNDGRQFFDFMSYLFDRQEQFLNGAFLTKTHQDLRNLAAHYAMDFANVDQNDFFRKIDSNQVYTLARTPNRYAAARAVWGTPTFLINNADNVPVDHTSSLKDWQSVIDPLLENSLKNM